MMIFIENVSASFSVIFLMMMTFTISVCSSDSQSTRVESKNLVHSCKAWGNTLHRRPKWNKKSTTYWRRQLLVLNRLNLNGIQQDNSCIINTRCLTLPQVCCFTIHNPPFHADSLSNKASNTFPLWSWAWAKAQAAMLESDFQQIKTCLHQKLALPSLTGTKILYLSSHYYKTWTVLNFIYVCLCVWVYKVFPY